MAQIVRLAVERGTDVNAKTSDGRTALYYAARFGNIEACKALLDGGAKNIRASFGKTPLQRAEEEGHTDVVKLLQSSFGERARLQSSAKRLEDVCEDILHVLMPGASKAVLTLSPMIHQYTATDRLSPVALELLPF